MRDREVLVVVRRGRETLVLRRSAPQGGYWHVVAGGVDPGESAESAAARELREEVALRASVAPLPFRFAYGPVGAERAGRAAEVRVDCFVADAPPGWEPTLDWEHDDHRWLEPVAAGALLHYPEPREAVEIAFARSSTM